MGKRKKTDDTVVLELARKWFGYTEFEDDWPGSIMYMSDNPNAFGITVKAGVLLNTCDRTGSLSLVVLRDWFMSHSKDVALYGKNNIDIAKREKELYALFNSDVAYKAEKYLIKQFNAIYSQLYGIKYKDKNAIIPGILSVLNAAFKDLCDFNIDVYKRGKKSLKLKNWNSNVKIYGSLSDAVLDIERLNDGIYVCYITAYLSVHRYFAIFIKSGKTLISINDRVKESYAGEYDKYGGFNNGSFSSFPYDSMVGMGTSTEPSLVSLLKPYNTLRFTVLLLLIKLKYSGSIIYGEYTYIDYLVENIASVNERSDYWRFNNNLDLGVGVNQILYTDSIKTTELASSLVKNFSEGFQPGYVGIMREFIGTADELVVNKLYQYRGQLAEYIKDKINSRINGIGGAFELNTIYQDILNKSRERLISLAVKIYDNLGDGSDFGDVAISYLFDDIEVNVGFGKLFTDGAFIPPLHVLNNLNDNSTGYLDLETGEKCDILFKFNIYNITQLEELIGCVTELRDIFGCVGQEAYGTDLLFDGINDPVSCININELLGGFNLPFGIAFNLNNFLSKIKNKDKFMRDRQKYEQNKDDEGVIWDYDFGNSVGGEEVEPGKDVEVAESGEQSSDVDWDFGYGAAEVCRVEDMFKKEDTHEKQVKKRDRKK